MNMYTEDILWILGGLVVLVIVYFLTRRHQHQQDVKAQNAPYDRAINKTNYNIDNTGINQNDYSNLSPEEARRVKEQWDKEGYIPSDEEFHRVEDALKRG